VFRPRSEIYLGMSILDLSKTLKYDFRYNYVKKKYGPKAKLLITDTDSLMYEIETDDFFEDIREDIKDKFDTSNTENYNPSSLPRLIKKVPGMFKDEDGGKNISEFVVLRAKLYAYKKELDEEKKCKGAKKGVLKIIFHSMIIKIVFFMAKNSGEQ